MNNKHGEFIRKGYSFIINTKKRKEKKELCIRAYICIDRSRIKFVNSTSSIFEISKICVTYCVSTCHYYINLVQFLSTFISWSINYRFIFILFKMTVWLFSLYIQKHTHTQTQSLFSLKILWNKTSASRKRL